MVSPYDKCRLAVHVDGNLLSNFARWFWIPACKHLCHFDEQGEEKSFKAGRFLVACVTARSE